MVFCKSYFFQAFPNLTRILPPSIKHYISWGFWSRLELQPNAEAVCPTGPHPMQGRSLQSLYQMDRSIPSMLLVTRGCGDVKSNGKGRLREKLLDKVGLFIKGFCFINFLLGIFFFFRVKSFILTQVIKAVWCHFLFLKTDFEKLKGCRLGKTINDHFMISAPTAHSGNSFLAAWLSPVLCWSTAGETSEQNIHLRNLCLPMGDEMCSLQGQEDALSIWLGIGYPCSVFPHFCCCLPWDPLQRLEQPQGPFQELVWGFYFAQQRGIALCYDKIVNWETDVLCVFSTAVIFGFWKARCHDYTLCFVLLESLAMEEIGENTSQQFLSLPFTFSLFP